MYNLQTYSLVESEGCSVTEPDALGYYALQWAALNNLTAVAQYIVEVIDYHFGIKLGYKALANLTVFTFAYAFVHTGSYIAARDHTGQTALHSLVRGAIQVAELLFQEGDPVSAADSNGYQGSKQTAITEKIPATKRSMERFLFHVKALLYTTSSGCSFWMGNLKHKDLMGQLDNSLLE